MSTLIQLTPVGVGERPDRAHGGNQVPTSPLLSQNSIFASYSIRYPNDRDALVALLK